MTDVALPPVASAAPRRQVAAWALWDWGSAAFNAVIITFAVSYTHLTLPTNREV